MGLVKFRQLTVISNLGAVMDIKNIFGLVKDTFSEWNTDKASRLAAALAYYTVISLPALVILIIAITGSFLGEEIARGQVVAQLQGLIGEQGAEAIEAMIVAASQSTTNSLITSSISIAILIFGATAVVIQLQDALNTIWEVEPQSGNFIKAFILNRILSFGMVLGVAFLLLVSLILSGWLALLGEYMGGFAPQFKFLWAALEFTVSLFVITMLFALMFKYLPDVKIPWSDVIVGALLTAILFNLGKYLIGLYIGTSNLGSTYGTAGSIVVLLVWIYYSAQIFFLGAEFTQVYARRFGSRVEIAEYAQGVTEKMREEQGISHK